MSLRYHAKHAAVLAAVASLFAVSSAAAVESDDSQRELAWASYVPVSATCHPALGACPKQAWRSGSFANVVTPVAYANDAQFVDPASAACHPALKACAGWKRAVK